MYLFQNQIYLNIIRIKIIWNKINEYFKFHIFLDLKKYIIDEKNILDNEKHYNYKLKSTIIHKGSSYFGHYYSIVYDSKHNNWVKSNEKSISLFDITKLKIFFWRKR